MTTYNFGPFLLAFEQKETGDTISVAKMKRPKFHKNTQFYFYDFIAGQTSIPHRLMGDQLLCACGACGQLGVAADMDIGHIVDWKTYLTQHGVQTKSAAIAGYNDINNLRLEHPCCNRSHYFEKNTEGWPHPDGARIFDHLISAIENAPRCTSAQYVINERDDLNLLLAEPIVKHGSAAPIDWEEFKRPKWDKSTRAGLLQLWENLGKVKSAPLTDNGRMVKWLECASCRGYGVAHDMHIGHITNWVKYLIQMNVETVAEAQWAYNDLRNLQFEHAKCNLGHEWEDYNPDDSDFSYGPNDLRNIAPMMQGFMEAVSKNEAENWRTESGFEQYMQEYWPKSRGQSSPSPQIPSDQPIHVLIPRRVKTQIKNPDNQGLEEMFDTHGLMPPALNETDEQVQSGWHLGFPNK